MKAPAIWEKYFEVEKELTVAIEKAASVADFSSLFIGQKNAFKKAQSAYDNYKILNENTVYNSKTLINDLKGFFKSAEVYSHIPQFFATQINSFEEQDVDVLLDAEYLNEVYDFEIEENDYLGYDSFIYTVLTHKEEIRKYLILKSRQRYIKAIITYGRELKPKIPFFLEIPMISDLMEYLDNIMNIKKVLIEEHLIGENSSLNNTFLNIYKNEHKIHNRHSMLFSCN